MLTLIENIHDRNLRKFNNYYIQQEQTRSGFLLRAGTRVIYPAMTLHVPGYRPDGRSFFSVRLLVSD